MSSRDTFEGADKLAMYIACIKRINTTASVDRGALTAVMQYWTNQTNMAIIFCTILSTAAITIVTEFTNLYISLPFTLGAIWFAIRAWAFGRCAAIASRIWL